MITGSNTNVRHGGKLFHVQTEDSGRSNPHVISHLYYGGTILASQKTRYGELLDLESENLAKDVKLLIDEQHQLMLERLKKGVYDDIICARLEGETESGTEPVEPPPRAPAAPPMTAARPPAGGPDRAPRASAESIVSPKPLDEVILEYLVEKTRDRAPERVIPAADRSPKKE
jgi:hypothetical protein